jgi:hypothetical protein
MSKSKRKIDDASTVLHGGARNLIGLLSGGAGNSIGVVEITMTKRHLHSNDFIGTEGIVPPEAEGRLTIPALLCIAYD